MEDETAIFMAAFLCKLEMINKGRVQQVKQFDPSQSGCEIIIPTNNSIILAGMLAPISCAPNVESVRTLKNRSFMYALEPIKAGTQIFLSIYSSTIYTNALKFQRDMNHQMFHRHPCDCKACTDEWSEKLNNPNEFPMIPDEKSDLFEELSEEMCSIRRDMQASPLNKLGIVDFEIIVRIRTLIAKSWEHFPMPSQITCDMVKLMMELFEAFFSLKDRISYRLR
ncbi:hypothetical protein QAD02_001285 [Eretmocerus hayati]|uniref:Uncharacterized protein n=1 Tax=Eretmocerus hayati TaxID=131215 RepID=A0ACC2NG20_9HYME|nr:hypothetical protein QAD02_001285 [Eretmocerus hayati]